MSIFDIFRKKPNNSELYAAVKSLERCEIQIIPKKNGKVAHPSNSKIGGKPYLPRDFAWPTYTCTEENITRPLSFFCQINLSDIKPYDKNGLLPEQGMLYFFYECESFRWGFDPSDDGAARVFWYDTAISSDFAPIDIPAEIANEYVIPEIAVQFKARSSYPGFEEFDVINGGEYDCDDYDEVLASLGVDIDNDPEDHTLLGYADIIQSEMLTECERVSRGLDCGSPESYQSTPEDTEVDIIKCSADWTLLLQLSTISKGDFEFMFGDCGMIYFYIRKDDLAAGRFDKVRFSVQCG